MSNNNDVAIVFVYNAESGLINKLKDAVHKTVSPATYPCKLCDITYSPVHMRGRWRKFVATIPYPVEFSYIDLIEKDYQVTGGEYPSAWLKHDLGLSIWIGANEMNSCQTLDELESLVSARLTEIDAAIGVVGAPKKR